MREKLGAVPRLSAGGGALPVIMSIVGPRETHDYRNYNLFSARYKLLNTLFKLLPVLALASRCPSKDGHNLAHLGRLRKRTIAG